MYAQDDPQIIWVSKDYEGIGNGTYSAPFSDINSAVKSAQPGNTVVLQAGDYYDNVSIENSGTITRPIRIVSEEGAQSSVCCYASWYFYDISDLIVCGITFRDIPQHAIAVIGSCERNSFTKLHFHNCGTDKKTPCTFFFGGSGGQCNVVEDCIFDLDQSKKEVQSVDIPVGLMISEGDSEENAQPNRNHVFRRNSFIHYGCAIIVGTHDSPLQNYSHIVENNIIKNCANDGIRIKCGDTSVKGNVLLNCQENGISIVHGKSDLISNNRIEECVTGIRVNSADCTITNNCIIHSEKQAIAITGKSPGDSMLSGNTIIESNSCIDSGIDDGQASRSSILIDTDSGCIIRRNIFHGKGKPFSFPADSGVNMPESTLFANDNKVSGGCSVEKGCDEMDAHFQDLESGNYISSSGYGVTGWTAEGAEIPPRDLKEMESYKSAIFPHSSFFEQSGNETELYDRSLFLNEEQEDTQTDDENEDIYADSRGEDGIIDFSDWDE